MYEFIVILTAVGLFCILATGTIAFAPTIERPKASEVSSEHAVAYHGWLAGLFAGMLGFVNAGSYHVLVFLVFSTMPRIRLASMQTVADVEFDEQSLKTAISPNSYARRVAIHQPDRAGDSLKDWLTVIDAIIFGASYYYWDSFYSKVLIAYICIIKFAHVLRTALLHLETGTKATIRSFVLTILAALFIKAGATLLFPGEDGLPKYVNDVTELLLTAVVLQVLVGRYSNNVVTQPPAAASPAPHSPDPRTETSS